MAIMNYLSTFYHLDNIFHGVEKNMMIDKNIERIVRNDIEHLGFTLICFHYSFFTPLRVS